MKQKLFVGVMTLAIICLYLGVFSGSASAAATYDQSGDKTINVNVPALNTAAVTQLATASTLSFNAQQLAENTITSKTGMTVTYSYIWLDVNGTPVLAIDPPRAMP